MTVEGECDEKPEEDLRISVRDGVDGAREVEMEKDEQSIGVVLASLTVVLWRAEANDGAIG